MSQITIATIQVSPTSRQRIRLAAAVAGVTATEFIKRAALDHAEEVLRGLECGPDLLRELNPAGLARYKDAVAAGQECVDA